MDILFYRLSICKYTSALGWVNCIDDDCENGHDGSLVKYKKVNKVIQQVNSIHLLRDTLLLSLGQLEELSMEKLVPLLLLSLQKVLKRNGKQQTGKYEE